MTDLGTVTFIGAGPGDPELLTIKAQRIVAEADVLIYAGSLVNPAVLAYADPDAARYDSAGMTLDEQIAKIRKAVDAGRQVARLHTGDPALYGAITEQMNALEAVGIPYQIVPGVSSAQAAAAALGIEFTLPGDTQTVIFSRLAGRTPVPESEALQGLAAHRSSLVLFLSVGMIARVVEELCAAGYSNETPVAVVFRVSWPDELIVHGTLADITTQVEAAEITHHALIIVSPALDLARRQTISNSHLYGTAFHAPQTHSEYAIISLTRGGTRTGERLQRLLPNTMLYAPERFVDAVPNKSIIPYETSVRQVLQTAFRSHPALICIMASGIVIRDLAPLLRNKHSDPAVVVMDETGQFAISLLGGHKGGANQLAHQVADLLGGTAVATTASDVRGLPAIDLLSERNGWLLEDGSAMTACSAALVNGDPFGIVQDWGNRNWLPDPLPSHVTYQDSFDVLQRESPAAALVITYRSLPASLRETAQHLVVYRPRCLVVGIGCNRGTPAAEIQAAIDETLAAAQLAPASICALATIHDKVDERGLLQLCKQQGWPLRVFTRAEINAIRNVPTPSPAAHKALRVWGVAEPAALLAAEADTLIVKKRKFANVTVAIALVKEHAS